MYDGKKLLCIKCECCIVSCYDGRKVQKEVIMDIRREENSVPGANVVLIYVTM
jgi:hypothetical protein